MSGIERTLDHLVKAVHVAGQLDLSDEDVNEIRATPDLARIVITPAAFGQLESRDGIYGARRSVHDGSLVHTAYIEGVTVQAVEMASRLEVVA